MTRASPVAKVEQTPEGLDNLTGLPGRRKFTSDLTRYLASSGSGGLICMIDIDQFRFLNAVVGTSAGDHALQQVATFLLGWLNSGDLIGRTGDDEFTILFVGRDITDAHGRAESLVRALCGFRLQWRGQDFSLSACAGLAQISPGHRTEDVLQLAMAACGAAKDVGRGKLVLAGECLTSRYHTDARILTGLQSAIADDRLRLYAQEIFSLGPVPNDCMQFELLVHMVDTDGTEFPPSSIIPAAERHGFIRELDRWVIKAALVDNAALLHRHPNLSLSVNLSGPSMADPGLWPYVVALFEQSGVPGWRIQFEITETSAISDMAVALAFVESARAFGCKVALDDFGSGLSSFVYLRSFPVDCIKIDGAFVGEVTDPASVDRAVVTAIVGVARDLGLTVVAEHVDSTDILTTLLQLGIDKVQGFLISQPQPFKEMFEKR